MSVRNRRVLLLSSSALMSLCCWVGVAVSQQPSPPPQETAPVPAPAPAPTETPPAPAPQETAPAPAPAPQETPPASETPPATQPAPPATPAETPSPGTVEVPQVTVTPPPAPPPAPRRPPPQPAAPTPTPTRTPPPPPAPQPQPSEASTFAGQIQTLNNARGNIFAPLGTAPTTINREAIEALPQGTNANVDKVLLQFPGVSQDSAASGNLHVRNEHANVSYRINGILLPDGLGAFGQFLDTSFVGSLTLITGALPAQYGLRTAGIVDITTNSGAFDNTGRIGFYGGSRETRNTSIEYGGRTGSTEYFFTGRYLQNILGIENPTPSLNAIHDRTTQDRSFAYVSTIIDPTTRLSFIGGTSTSKFQIPNTPGRMPSFTAFGLTDFDSAKLNENQVERYRFGMLALQKSVADADVQLAYFTRSATVHFIPDPIGDLMFNGVATDVFRGSVVNGIQSDSAFRLNETHTLRTGLFVSAEKSQVTNSSQLLPIDSTLPAPPPIGSNQILPDVPFGVVDSSSLLGWLAGVYVSDEWRITDKLTLTTGGRFDQMSQYQTANQFSPRVGMTYKPYDSTTFHAGYARTFTPPVQVIAAPTNTALFTSCPASIGNPNCTTVQAPSVPPPYNPFRPERAHVFDIGVTQKVAPGLELGVDAYHKIATDLIDDGQFGPALVLNGFNYEQAQNTGVELKALYSNGNFRAYANWAWAYQRAHNIVTNQFLFDPDRLAFSQTNWIYTDHAQVWTGSGGVSYLWDGTRFSADVIYGSGLRAGFANTDHNAPYAQVNAGVSREFGMPGWLPMTLRFDVVNVFDTSYAIRNGTGIGVFAPQFGPRRAYYLGLSQKFGPGTPGEKPAAPPTYSPVYGASGLDKRPMLYKAPTEAPWTWAGFYLGLNVGQGWGKSRTDTVFTDGLMATPLYATAATGKMSGVFGGGQAGFNWVAGNWLAGIETDLQSPTPKATFTSVCPGAVCNPAITSVDSPVAVVHSHKLDWFATLRGRLGAIVTPDAVAYATGGLAVAGISQEGTISGVAFSAMPVFDDMGNPVLDDAGNPIVATSTGPVNATMLGRSTRLGWSAGGGAEVHLAGNWTGKVEYLHMDFGTATITGSNTVNSLPVIVDLKSRITDDIVRLGLNYKFSPYGGYSPLYAAPGGNTALITKAPVAAPWTWSGYYLGINAGYGWGKSGTDALFDDTLSGGSQFVTNASFNLNGALGGAQTGYNWQFGSWLAGIEGDLQLTAQRGNPTFACPAICNPAGPDIAGFDQNQHLQWFATLRGRLGTTVTPDAVAYVTGGLAVGGFETGGTAQAFDFTGAAATSPFSSISTRPGWTAGAGLETHLFGNWTAKLEYLYLVFRPLSTTQANLTNVTLANAFNSRVTDNIVRAGLNYKFDN